MAAMIKVICFCNDMVKQKLLWSLTPLAAVTLIAGERPANAVLTYSIYQSGPDVVIEANGSLNLSSPLSGGSNCATPGVDGGAIFPSVAIFCTGATPPVKGTHLKPVTNEQIDRLRDEAGL